MLQRFANKINSRLTSEELVEVRGYLNEGAAANQLIDLALSFEDILLLQLLKEYHADFGFSSTVDDQSPKNQEPHQTYQWRLKNGLLPVQQILMAWLNNFYDPILPAMYQFLFDNTPFLDQTLITFQETANQLYAQLCSLIQREMNIARANNKNMVVLIGNNHLGLNSHLIELMIMQICFDKNDFLKFLLEISDEKLKILSSPNKRWENGKWHEIEPIYDAFVASYKNKEAIAIDLGRTETDKPYSEEGMKHRNNVMFDQINSHATGNVVVSVGVEHLYGLLEESDLAKQFHVVPINASGTTKKLAEQRNFHAKTKSKSYRDKCDEYALRENIQQAVIIPSFGIEESIFGPTVIKQVVNKAVEAHANDKSQDIFDVTQKTRALTISYHTRPLIIATPLDDKRHKTVRCV
jgi:hypothetical protein